MSRTIRKHATDANYREARKGRGDKTIWSTPGSTRRNFRGGMVMSPAVSGIWGDERYQSASDRKAQRRTQRRIQKARAIADAVNS